MPAPSWERLSQDDVENRTARMLSQRHLYRGHEAVRLAFAACAVCSTGVSAVDALLCRSGVGDSGGGGIELGTVTELYGPPMAGKSYLLQSIASSFVRKMSIVQQKQQQHQQQESAGDERGMLHTKWDVYQCLSAGEAFGDHAGSGGWRAVAARALGNSDMAARSYGDSHVHIVPINTPNTLLAFLSWLVKDSNPARERVGHVRCHRTHVLVVVDSLTSVWQHSTLAEGASAHATRWFAAEFHRLLTTLSTGGGDAATQPGCRCTRTVTTVVSNGCAFYQHSTELLRFAPRPHLAWSSSAAAQRQRNQGSTSSSGDGVAGESLRSSSFPPRPLGEELWWSAPATRLFVEPSVPQIVAVIPPQSSAGGTREQCSDSEEEEDRACATSVSVQGPQSRVTLVKGGGEVQSCFVPWCSAFQ